MESSVESAIGAHLLKIAYDRRLGLFYWRESNKEVDFVVRSRKKLIAIEVNTGRAKGVLSGMAAFDKAFSPQHKPLIGKDRIPVAELLKSDLSEWLG